MGEDIKVKYDLNSHFEDIHIPTFLLVSGTLFGIEQLLAHPFEVLRTHFQTNRTVSSYEIFKSVIQKSGIRALYVGFFAATIGHLPGSLIYITSYVYYKDKLQKIDNRLLPVHDDGRQSPYVSFAASILADVTAISLYCPVDVIVQRLYIRERLNKKKMSSFNILKTIVSKEGIRGLYRGFTIELFNSLPASAVWWTTYEYFKMVISKRLSIYQMEEDNSPNNVLVVKKHWIPQFFAGALSGTIVAVITNPLDVVRTRFQTQTYTHSLEKQYKRPVDMIRSIVKTEGVKGFMKGITPRLLSWTIFSCSGAILYELADRKSVV